ncbi:MAG: polysaccharide deacetylase family protein [Ignavibacteriales bacterium]|nr:polysaccharide deacetylase family protein [Ignavibacteriales bacterium]MCB9208720.1 polysaccharide deacetylase family protein [Ignavibacteriales bacterium]MCB9218362.1 polysaccharide deacetylase family protein [Ignavibacteriales bacterium]
MKILIKLIFTAFISLIILNCSEEQSVNENNLLEGKNWAEKLGYPAGKKILIMHADDIGMCDEANISVYPYLEKQEIQSAAIMVPCQYAEDAIKWAVENPDYDLGLHLTLTSEWKTYRWGTIADPNTVPGLLDDESRMYRSVREVVENAKPDEVDKEIRAQIEKAISLGMKPYHIDTHMGTLYGSSEFVKVFFKVAEEYNIPANAIDLSNPVVAEHFKKAGYPIDDKVIETVNNYKLPKLDFFSSVPKGNTYEEKREYFLNHIKELPAGLIEIIFHPSIETENLKTITNSWQQRVWEAEIFSDPIVKQFFIDEGIVFTNWKEIMSKFNSLTKK